jgi:hypothetical protein
MLEQLLTQQLWLALLAWALSYASDFALTMHTARLYHGGARQHFSFGGSFELTPYYQADVDRLRRWSPRFWLALGLSMVLMALVWVLSVVVLGLPVFFTFLVGALLLRQAAVHLRHLRNLVLFRAVRDTAAVSGQITYFRPLVLKLSAAEFAAFGGLFLLLALVTSSWFLLGGAVACCVTAYQHIRLARAAQRKATVPGA